MKILYVYSEERWKEHITNTLSGHEVIFVASLDEVTADFSEIEVLSVFVNHQVTKEHIDAMPNLKLIATRSTGYDHIDKEAAKAVGVKIATVPIYGENTVAEFTFALLLAVSRRVYESYKQVSETGSFAKNNLRGFDLHGKTIGVVGTGKIGLNVVRIAKGFEMNVIAYDAYPKQEEAERLAYSYVSFEELLRSSDIITIHTPYNESTHHMINKDNIQMIKPGAYLINTARGGMVETHALVQSLRDGIIAGAGLDVLEEEGVLGDELKLLDDPHPNSDHLRTTLANHYLIDHPRVIITPHNAFNTDEAMKRIIDTTIFNMRSFIEGEATNIVE